MKIQILSLFLRSLVEPLNQTGLGSDNVNNLSRACDLLSSLGEMTVSQFADLLDQVKEYQVSKQHTFPTYLEPVINCYESLQSLRKRTGLPDVNREDLARDLDAVSLDSLELKDLSQIATAHGWTVPPKATKPAVIDIIWKGITGQEKPKKSKAAKPRAPRTTSSVSLDDYAQKINGLKERANSEVSRAELEKELDELKLDKLSKNDLVALGKQLACDVNSGTKKGDAVDAIRRVVLEVKEMFVGSAG